MALGDFGLGDGGLADTGAGGGTSVAISPGITHVGMRVFTPSITASIKPPITHLKIRAFTPGISGPIIPTIVHLGMRIFSPVLAFSPKKISPVRTSVAIRVFPPTLVGGLTTLQVWLAGKNVTQYCKVKATELNSNASGRWTAKVVFEDQGGSWVGPLITTDPTFGVGVSLVITEGGDRLFAGCVTDITSSLYEGTPTPAAQYTVNATDKAGIFDRRTINKTYAAGQDIADIVRDIMLTINTIGNEGVSLDGVPATLGALPQQEIFNYAFVTNAFDRLAQDGLLMWWVDAYSVLHFASIAEMPTAPYNLTETSQNWINITAKASLVNGYRNLQHVVSNLSAEPNGIPSVTETYTLPQPEAVSRGFRLGTIVLKQEASAIITLKVNGVQQPIRDGYTPALNTDKSWWILLPTIYLYAPDSALTLPTPPFGFAYPTDIPAGCIAATSPFPAPGDIIDIEYRPASNNSQTLTTDALSPADPTLMTCGSGIVEAVEQVQNISSLEDLQAIAQALLDRNNTVPVELNWQTDAPGLRVGQRITININKPALTALTATITQMQGRHMGPTANDRLADKTKRGLGKGSGWRWQVTANTGVDRANQLKIYERLIARTANPLPIPRYEVAQFVLAPGSSIAAGSIPTNPQVVLQTGQLFDITVQFGVPPTDQTLVLDILNDVFGGSILNSAKIVVASGDGSKQTITRFINDPTPITIYAGSSFSPVVSYNVTGANPTLAGSGTVLIRWKI